jgi:hypothetical protein
MKFSFLFLFLLIPYILLSQNIVGNHLPKTVPQGKKWVLNSNEKILIEVNSSSQRSGNLCNALLTSSPRIANHIVEGEIGKPRKIYSVLFKNIENEPFSNSNTYSIVPTSFLTGNSDMYEILSNKNYNAGIEEIVFYPGERVFVSTCLVNIQLKEIDLSGNEKAIQDRKNEVKRINDEKNLMEERRKNRIELERILNEKKEKITNSNHYFSYNDIKNRKDIKFNFDNRVLNILYEYVKEYYKNKPSEYLRLVNEYKTRINNIRENDKYKDNISLFDFSFYFDKEKVLKEVSKGDDLWGKQPTSLGIENISKIGKVVNINSAGEIHYEDSLYKVNSILLLHFNIDEVSNQGEAFIKLKKNKDIEIVSNSSKYFKDDLIALLSNEIELKTLRSGNYKVYITSKDIILRGWTSHDYSSVNKSISSSIINKPNINFEPYKKMISDN